MKILLGIVALLVSVPVLIGALGQGLVTAVFGGDSQPSHQAINDIPPDYLALYMAAAPVCPGLSWSILAAIGKVETDHSRSNLPGVREGENSAGAGGPMQFLKGTFGGVIARHSMPEGGSNPPSRYNPHDAVYAAAFYLCDSGAGRGDIRSAVFAYNHADWYVAMVLAQAAIYASTIGRGADTAPSAASQQAINYATGQLGLPYVWGGDGPSQGEAGFDCSGLTKAAYASAGIDLPRKAQWQFDAGPRLAPGTPLLPGDLVFFGPSPTNITHVGIAISPTHMINAPYTGAVIRVDPIGHYTGAARPASTLRDV